jgi:hypothetical protein
LRWRDHLFDIRVHPGNDPTPPSASDAVLVTLTAFTAAGFSIDFTWSHGLTKLKGIYVLEGNKLKNCHSKGDNERPRKFVSGPDGTTAIFVFERLAP